MLDLLTNLVNRTTVYLKENEEVKSVIKNSFADLTDQTKVDFFKNVDVSKFRDDVSPKMVLNIVFWVAEGFMQGRNVDDSVDLVSLNDEFVEHLELLKKVFYK